MEIMFGGGGGMGRGRGGKGGGGVLLRETKPDIIVRETCVLLCLDVSFIFFTKLLAVIAW